VGFGAKQPVAEVALTLAKSREDAAKTGDSQGDGEMRLEQLPRRREKTSAGRRLGLGENSGKRGKQKRRPRGCYL
jgi:hypothetical protein